ncbi:NPCBM/NEW2 domain-containing protein [Bacillus toyonensis]|uniref:NPCBM/NEW2 domain-containing protein n=1 Tax=Bacillus toyonensis TaxID=155322 RepID=UPI001C0B29B5|nr:NPCBM/NEW2 domain-containing protein [Bacillus toyonensis]MBU4643141.1 NPCBM/NEW2 domain-containing protein [Bacillus toyonensis]
MILKKSKKLFKVLGVTTALTATILPTMALNSTTAQADEIVVEPPQSGFHLSDFGMPSKSKLDWGSVQLDRNINGGVLSLNNVKYFKGLGAHSNGEIQYDLNGQYDRFISVIGVDDTVGYQQGSVIFQVFADGIKVYDSGIMKAGDSSKKVDISIQGAFGLKLVVLDGDGNINNDHANWADAQLYPTLGSPLLPPECIG